MLCFLTEPKSTNVATGEECAAFKMGTVIAEGVSRSNCTSVLAVILALSSNISFTDANRRHLFGPW